MLFSCFYRSLSESFGKFNTFNYNLNNFNNLNPTSSTVVVNFNGKASNQWYSEKEIFKQSEIYSITTSVGYTQLTKQHTHIIKKQHTHMNIALNLDVICSLDTVSIQCLQPHLTKNRFGATKGPILKVSAYYI